MKMTKTVLLTTLAIGGLLACASARAQESTNMPEAASTNAAPHHPMFRGPSIQRMALILNLTPDQKTKVEPIMDERDQKMRDIFQDNTLSRDDRMAKIQQIRSDTDTQLKPILTDEQFQKWQQMSQPRHRRMMMQPPGVTNGATASAP